MEALVTALMVHQKSESLSSLEVLLERLSANVSHAYTWQEVKQGLESDDPPYLVWTDVALADGTWADVVDLASGAPVPVNVIVVAGEPDVKLYLDVINRGGYDFVAPPFVLSDIAHIVRSAALNVVSRRDSQARLISLLSPSPKGIPVQSANPSSPVAQQTSASRQPQLIFQPAVD